MWILWQLFWLEDYFGYFLNKLDKFLFKSSGHSVKRGIYAHKVYCENRPVTMPVAVLTLNVYEPPTEREGSVQLTSLY
jgi:hypothetical protein